jgi:hypothetical protein
VGQFEFTYAALAGEAVNVDAMRAKSAITTATALDFKNLDESDIVLLTEALASKTSRSRIL